MTYKVCIIRCFLNEHLYEIAYRYFFLNTISTGPMDPPQLLFNRTQGRLCEHAQIDLRLVASLSLAPSDYCLSFLDRA